MVGVASQVRSFCVAVNVNSWTSISTWNGHDRDDADAFNWKSVNSHSERQSS